jgi:hypothetical protein
VDEKLPARRRRTTEALPSGRPQAALTFEPEPEDPEPEDPEEPDDPDDPEELEELEDADELEESDDPDEPFDVPDAEEPFDPAPELDSALLLLSEADRESVR